MVFNPDDYNSEPSFNPADYNGATPEQELAVKQQELNVEKAKAYETSPVGSKVEAVAKAIASPIAFLSGTKIAKPSEIAQYRLDLMKKAIERGKDPNRAVITDRLAKDAEAGATLLASLYTGGKGTLGKVALKKMASYSVAPFIKQIEGQQELPTALGNAVKQGAASLITEKALGLGANVLGKVGSGVAKYIAPIKLTKDSFRVMSQAMGVPKEATEHVLSNANQLVKNKNLYTSEYLENLTEATRRTIAKQKTIIGRSMDAAEKSLSAKPKINIDDVIDGIDSNLARKNILADTHISQLKNAKNKILEIAKKEGRGKDARYFMSEQNLVKAKRELSALNFDANGNVLPGTGTKLVGDAASALDNKIKNNLYREAAQKYAKLNDVTKKAFSQSTFDRIQDKGSKEVYSTIKNTLAKVGRESIDGTTALTPITKDLASVSPEAQKIYKKALDYNTYRAFFVKPFKTNKPGGLDTSLAGIYGRNIIYNSAVKNLGITNLTDPFMKNIINPATRKTTQAVIQASSQQPEIRSGIGGALIPQ